MFCGFALCVFALPPMQPTLPPVAYLDTETVTNVPFTAWQQHLRHFTDLVVGWDCGAWFVEDGTTGARVTAARASVSSRRSHRREPL